MNKAHNPIIVGLDIGTTKVVAIAGRKNEFGKLEILGFGKSDSAGVNHGVVMNIEQCIRSINQAMESCLASNPNLEIKEVYVGIAGQHIKSLQTRGDLVRNNTDDEIKNEDIERLIRDQLKTFIPAGDQIIDIIPQDFIVDNTPNVLNPVGMSGVKIGANFHIVTGDRNAIRNIRRCVEKSNLNTVDLVLQPLASAAAVMNDEDLEAGVAIIDIGGGTSDMAVFYDGILQHTAVIPYAGTNITEDIRQGLGVLRAQAEQMKVQFGKAIPDEANKNAYITIPGLKGLAPKEISVKNLAHIINARVHEIFEYVVYHLKQINLDKKLHGGIILTGGGSKLENILQLCEFVTGLSTRIGIPNEHLAGSNGELELLSNPMYSTCIGLILRGYSDFETGKVKLEGMENTMMNMVEEVVARQEVPIKENKPTFKANNTKAELPVMSEDELMEEEQLMPDKQEKRGETIKKIFSTVRKQFMQIFEDPNDTKID